MILHEVMAGFGRTGDCLALDTVSVAPKRISFPRKQGYYRWRAIPVTERDWVDAHLVNAASDTHADDQAFGYRFIADELPGMGITAGENRAQRLCRDHGICSVFAKKRGLSRKPEAPVHDDRWSGTSPQPRRMSCG